MATAGNAMCLVVKNVLLRMSARTASTTTGLILSMENVCAGGLPRSPILWDTVITVMWKGVLPVWATIQDNVTSAMTPKHQLLMGSVCALMAKS